MRRTRRIERRRAAGLKCRLTKQEAAQLAQMYMAGASAKSCAAVFGVKKSAVYYALRNFGLKTRKWPPCKLSEEQHAELIALYRSGKSVVEIAKAFGYTEVLVYKSIRRKGANRHRDDPMYRCTLREDAFDNPIHDPQAAYWIGFLMTDGCVTGSGSKPFKRWAIRLGLCERDKGHVQKFRDFLGSDAKIRLKDRTVSRGRSYLIVKSSRACDFSSKCPEQMRASLARCGVVPRKTFIAEAKVIHNNRHFWRGCIDGDGTIAARIQCGAHYPVVKFCGGSEKLVKQFANFVSRITGKRYMMGIKLVDGFQPQFSTGAYGPSAMQVINVLYGNAPVSLDRKQQRADYLLEIERVNPHWMRNKTSGVKPIILPLWPDPFAATRKRPQPCR